jgi:hypothetical protein
MGVHPYHLGSGEKLKAKIRRNKFNFLEPKCEGYEFLFNILHEC